jgi:hypothetical protein
MLQTATLVPTVPVRLEQPAVRVVNTIASAYRILRSPEYVSLSSRFHIGDGIRPDFVVNPKQYYQNGYRHSHIAANRS